MMNDVNARPPDRQHLAFLLNRVIRRMRDEAASPVSWPSDLTAAKARLIEAVPPGGCRIVDLSGELRVSKQGLGQLVKQLVDSGHLRETPDPADRRARHISRTHRGDEVVGKIHELTGELEARWRKEIGAKRYDVFREVLVQLVAAGPEPDE
jgi:DNA-binding MarR family transcriptional regulator